MTVIFFFGEELTDRQHGREYDVVKDQLKHGSFQISENDWKQVILAYEPVWAIGTGETASPEQAQEMHAFIRSHGRSVTPVYLVPLSGIYVPFVRIVLEISRNHCYREENIAR